MLMQMLDAAGIPILSDGLRTADESNPRGYLEYEPVKKLASDNRWVSAAGGKAVKIILQLLPHLPAGVPVKVLFLNRPVEEVVESQNMMLQRLGRKIPADPAILIATFQKQQQAALEFLKQRPSTSVLEVSQKKLIARDADQIQQMAAFLNLSPEAVPAMLAAIDPSLNRVSKTTVRPEVPAKKRRLAWQSGQIEGLIVVSVPKSGTNFLSRYLSQITGWQHRWGRPSRDQVDLLAELPIQPDAEVVNHSKHLIQTSSDIAILAPEQRPELFGGRRLLSLEPERENEIEEGSARQSSRNLIIAEHPIRSLPWLLRNPATCPVVDPAEVEAEAAQLNYGVLFLHRDLRDVANSLAHFLHAGTRFIHFSDLPSAFNVVTTQYIPVLARAIRLWKKKFSGRILTYENLHRDTRPTIESLIEEFQLPLMQSKVIDAMDQYRTFTFRKGGTGDWQENLPTGLAKSIETDFPDLINL